MDNVQENKQEYAMELKYIEIKVMSDEAYGDHLNHVFEDIKLGKLSEEQSPSIVARTPEDVAKILTNERVAFSR